MGLFPSLPPWHGIHPLVVHFPIALLIVAPLFIMAGLLGRRMRTGLFLAAWLLMALGTTGSFVAVESGEAAGELAERTPQINALLERHQDLGETTRNVFTVLTILFGAILLLPKWIRPLARPVATTTTQVIFVLIYLGCTSLVANTGHLGGRLVHEQGVRAMIGTSSTDTPEPEAADLKAPHRDNDD